MKKVYKTKSKSKKTAPRKSVKKTKHYSVHLLVIAIALLITGESALAFNTNSSDWKQGFALLDVSEGVSTMVADVNFVFQPAVQTATGVNEFYSQAAIASTELLDNSSSASDSMMFVFGVNEFYKAASRELANVLDLSKYVSPQPAIAGASISR